MKGLVFLILWLVALNAVAVDPSRIPVTSEVTNIISDRAELHGSLRRVARLRARVAFQMRPLGAKLWVRRTPWQRLDHFQDNVLFSGTATNLKWNTEYEVRAVSVVAGMIRKGNVVQFHSSPGAPQIVAATQTNVTSSNAVITGTFFPNQNVTTTWFEWGTSTNYEFATSSSEFPAGVSGQDIAAPLKGLSANTTTYHWRLVASNATGVATSPDAAFIATDYVGIPEGYTWTFSSELPYVGMITNMEFSQKATAAFQFLRGTFSTNGSLLCEMLGSGAPPTPAVMIDAPADGGSFFSVGATVPWGGVPWGGVGTLRFTMLTGSVVLTNLVMTYEFGIGFNGERRLYATNASLRTY